MCHAPRILYPLDIYRPSHMPGPVQNSHNPKISSVVFQKRLHGRFRVLAESSKEIGKVLTGEAVEKGISPSKNL